MGLLFPESSTTTKNSSSIDNNNNSFIENKIAETKDTFIHRTAISPSRYNEIYGTLLGYTQGTPQKTEYYHLDMPMVNKQTGMTDLSSTRHSIHTQYQLIHNFEIRFLNQLDAPYNEESTEMTIDGEATTYPGFSPTIGDVFLYELPAKALGIFQVNNVTRMSIHQGTEYKISFHLAAFAENDHEMITKLNTSVVEELYFDKQKFLSNNATLLKSVDYEDLVFLRNARKSIINFYIDKFYDYNTKSVVRPDGIYDPYLVEFLNTKISFLDNPKVIDQCVYDLTDYKNSFWYLMGNSEYVDMSLLYKNGFKIKNVREMFDVGITASLNKDVLTLSMRDKKKDAIIQSNENTPTYILSEAFYNNDLVNTTEFEKLLIIAIRDKKVDVSALVNYVKNYTKEDDNAQFYFLPMYLYLIDIALNQIS